MESYGILLSDKIIQKTKKKLLEAKKRSGKHHPIHHEMIFKAILQLNMKLNWIMRPLMFQKINFAFFYFISEVYQIIDACLFY